MFCGGCFKLVNKIFVSSATESPIRLCLTVFVVKLVKKIFGSSSSSSGIQNLIRLCSTGFAV